MVFLSSPGNKGRVVGIDLLMFHVAVVVVDYSVASMRRQRHETCSCLRSLIIVV